MTKMLPIERCRDCKWYNGGRIDYCLHPSVSWLILSIDPFETLSDDCPLEDAIAEGVRTDDGMGELTEARARIAELELEECRSSACIMGLRAELDDVELHLAPLFKDRPSLKPAGLAVVAALCIAELEAMLKRLEWTYATPDGRYHCPTCWGFGRDGHADDCELAALLRGGAR